MVPPAAGASEESMMRFDPEGVDWPEPRRPGVRVKVLHVDPATNDAAVLILMDPGATYPRHRHVREEDVFVLSSGYCDDQGEHPAGSFTRYEAGSIHAPVAFAGSEPCVLFAVARGGIELLR
jgi:anti-sigma factor ChrR (cupin superfamily)